MAGSGGLCVGDSHGQVGWAEVMKNVECQSKEFGVREFLDFFQSFCAFMNFCDERTSHFTITERGFGEKKKAKYGNSMHKAQNENGGGRMQRKRQDDS